MCLVNIRSTQKGGVKIALDFPPWSLSVNHFVRLSIHKFFTGSLNVTTKSFPLIVNNFFSFLLDLTFEMPDKWTVFLPVGSVLSHFPHRSLEFLDSFRTRTGVSSVVFVWFFSRSTSLESVYPFGYFVFGQRTDCKVFESKSYNETVAESFKGQMNQKIDIFSFVALPSPNTKKNHPKWDLGKDFSSQAFIER